MLRWGACLNVGCIPSKALLHVAAVMDEVSHMAALGIDFGAPSVNIDKLRGDKASPTPPPEVAWAGLTEDQAKAQGIKVKKGLFPWTDSGRAIASAWDMALPSCCLMTTPMRTATGKFLAAAWLAPTPAT